MHEKRKSALLKHTNRKKVSLTNELTNKKFIAVAMKEVYGVKTVL